MSSNTIIIGGERIKAPDGLIVNNYMDDGEIKFKHRRFKKPPKWIILHETAGRTAYKCKETLTRRNLGVQFIVDRISGTVTQHGDPARDMMWHAKHMSHYSVGIEFVNPYAPMIAKGLEYETIPAEWWTWIAKNKDKRYVLPTRPQIEAMFLLVPFLCEQLNIPFQFPTIGLDGTKGNKKVARRGLKRQRIPNEPGIIAHQDTSTHADGRYLLEYLAQPK